MTVACVYSLTIKLDYVWDLNNEAVLATKIICRKIDGFNFRIAYSYIHRLRKNQKSTMPKALFHALKAAI